MKRFLLLAAFLLLFPAAVSAQLLDAFNIDGADVGANWTPFSTRDCQVSGNTFQPTNLGSRCMEAWNANSYPSDQDAQATIKALNAGADIAAATILLRVDSATEKAYRCGAQAGGSQTSFIVRYAPSGTTIFSDSSVTWAVNDTVRCTATGGTTNPVIRLYQNTTLVTTLTDTGANMTGDRIGLSCYATDAQSDCQLDDFTFNPPAAANRAIVILVQ